MKHVLLVTDGFFHPPLLGRLALRRSLKKMEGYTFQNISSLEALPYLDMPSFSSLVIYLHHTSLSGAALEALDHYASHGGGILGLHSATASFKTCRPYFEIIGGRFTGHGKVSAFSMTPVPNSQIFGGLPAFTVRDELYLHELQAGIQVHFTALYAGKPVPAVWTRRYGKGKICYIVPGHTTGSMQNPALQVVIKRGLEWTERD